MDQTTYDKAVSIQRQIDTVKGTKRSVLSSFDSAVSEVDEPEFGNLTASLRNSLAGYFDGKIAPLTEQFNAL